MPRALVANYLISLDKCPEHVLDKAVCFTTSIDVKVSCDADLLCGVRSDIEDAIYAMTCLFSQHRVYYLLIPLMHLIVCRMQHIYLHRSLGLCFL